MGWSHWATEMCLGAVNAPTRQSGRILRVPVFHNVTRKATISQAQEDASTQRLMERYGNTQALGLLRRVLAQAA
jgi:hypothetical protein